MAMFGSKTLNGKRTKKHNNTATCNTKHVNYVCMYKNIYIQN